MNESGASFQTVARRQLPWMYSLARRLAGERADDVVQDTLIRAFRAYGDLEDLQAAPAWFRTILVNSARDRFRKEAAGVDETPMDDLPRQTLYQTIAEEDPWPYSDSVHLDFLHSLTEEDVWEVLNRLKPMYRVPLVLVHMEGMEVSDVARLLDAPYNTVLSWLHRGRKFFERELWEHASEKGLVREDVRVS